MKNYAHVIVIDRPTYHDHSLVIDHTYIISSIVNTQKSMPSSRSSNSVEKKLGLWFRQYKGAVNGKNRGKNYENVTSMLKDKLGEAIFN